MVVALCTTSALFWGCLSSVPFSTKLLFSTVPWVACSVTHSLKNTSHPLELTITYWSTTNVVSITWKYKAVSITKQTCVGQFLFWVWLPRARVNQPPWLHQLAVLSIGWAGWFASFSFTSLPYVNQHSTTVNLFWLLTFDHFFFHCQFFLNPDLHTTHPPSNYIDLNLSPAY